MWTNGAPWLVTLVRNEIGHAPTALDGVGRLSLWRLVGRKSLVEERGVTRLIVHSSAKWVQVRLGRKLRQGDPFAYQIPAVADERAVWAAVTEFRGLMLAGRGLVPQPGRPGRTDVFHIRALQVLDGLAAGATQRQLAKAIFGTVAADRSWQPDGALRAQLRYLVRKSKALMEGDYRSLVSSAG